MPSTEDRIKAREAANRMKHEITFEDDGTICIGGAPIAKVMRAHDFPCRDEGKTDEEHDDELEDCARHVVALAEAARQFKVDVAGAAHEELTPLGRATRLTHPLAAGIEEIDAGAGTDEAARG